MKSIVKMKEVVKEFKHCKIFVADDGFVTLDGCGNAFDFSNDLDEAVERAITYEEEMEWLEDCIRNLS